MGTMSERSRRGISLTEEFHQWLGWCCRSFHPLELLFLGILTNRLNFWRAPLFHAEPYVLAIVVLPVFPIFLPSITGPGVISLLLKVCHEASLLHGSPTSLSFLILVVLASEQAVEFC